MGGVGLLHYLLLVAGRARVVLPELGRVMMVVVLTVVRRRRRRVVRRRRRIVRRRRSWRLMRVVRLVVRMVVVRIEVVRRVLVLRVRRSREVVRVLVGPCRRLRAGKLVRREQGPDRHRRRAR